MLKIKIFSEIPIAWLKSPFKKNYVKGWLVDDLILLYSLLIVIWVGSHIRISKKKFGSEGPILHGTWNPQFPKNMAFGGSQAP